MRPYVQRRTPSRSLHLQHQPSRNRRKCVSFPHPYRPTTFTPRLTSTTVLSKTNSGGVTINDIMTHAGVPNAPFGGVGNSGTGAYRGRYGFDAFTHRRTVVNIPGWMDYLLGFRYPPYDKKNISKIAINKPGFKRGEGMEDQIIGSGKMRRLVGMMGRWVILVVGLALVDARMGGRPRLLEVLGGLVHGVRSRLPM